MYFKPHSVLGIGNLQLQTKQMEYLLLGSLNSWREWVETDHMCCLEETYFTDKIKVGTLKLNDQKRYTMQTLKTNDKQKPQLYWHH